MRGQHYMLVEFTDGKRRAYPGINGYGPRQGGTLHCHGPGRELNIPLVVIRWYVCDWKDGGSTSPRVPEHDHIWADSWCMWEGCQAREEQDD